MSTGALPTIMVRNGMAVVLAAAALVAGCRTIPPDGSRAAGAVVEDSRDVRPGLHRLGDPLEPGVDQPVIRERVPVPDPDQDVLYQLLLAELASVSRQPEVALEAWLRAMQQSGDPVVAQRTAGAALRLQREDIAIEASRRWVALDPDGLDARRTLGLLLVRAGAVDEARAQFNVVLDAPQEQAEQRMSLLGGLLARETDADADAVLALLSGLAEVQRL